MKPVFTNARYAIAKACMTQQEVAALIGVPFTSMAQYLNRRKAPPEVEARLAEALGVPRERLWMEVGE